MRYTEIIKESMLLTASSSSVPAYIQYTNDLLKANKPLKMGTNGQYVFQPNPGQQITNLQTSIAGQGQDHQGKEVTAIVAKNIFKGPDYEAARTGTDPSDKIKNKGEITEGLFAIAMLAKLTEGRANVDIQDQHLVHFIKQLPPKGPAKKAFTVPETETTITDTFAFIVALKPAVYSDLRNVDKVLRLMPKEIRSILDFVNDKSMDRYMQYFNNNNKPDYVTVVADGISNESGTKVDVFMHYVDETGKTIKQNFDLSVKVGTVKQFGQVGGGAQKQSIEERFNILNGMWQKLGIDISPIKDEFVATGDVLKGYPVAYEYAQRALSAQLAGATFKDESEEIQTLIEGIKHFATLNDPRVKLVQFTQQGYYVLDFKHLAKLYKNNKIDLDARYRVSSSGKPQVEIYNKLQEKKNILITIRMKLDDGYIRNYIEKGELLKELTMVRTSIKKEKK